MLFGKDRGEKTLEDEPVVKDQLAGKDFESSPITWTEEERQKLEKKFLRKLDLRMSILVVVRSILAVVYTQSLLANEWHSRQTDLHSKLH